MNNWKFLDDKGTFYLEEPDMINHLYFPLGSEKGALAFLTPLLTSQDITRLDSSNNRTLARIYNSRNFWIYEEQNAWSAMGISAKQIAQVFTEEKEKTKLTAGLLWHKVERISEKEGFYSAVTSFVPIEGKLELMKVKIRNISGRIKIITPTAAISMYEDTENYKDRETIASLTHIETAEYGVIKSTIGNLEENIPAVYAVFGAERNGAAPVGFFPVAEGFIGQGGFFENPEAIIKNKETEGQAGEKFDGYDAMGALRFEDVILGPDEEAVYLFVFGRGDSKESVKKEAERYLIEKDFDQAWEKVKNYWEKQNDIHYYTRDQDFDRWMYWVNFQTILGHPYHNNSDEKERSKERIQGWTELWQNSLSCLLKNPEQVREQLYSNFAYIRFDGSNLLKLKNKQIITDKMIELESDYGIWSYLITEAYINQSGDLEFLTEQISYFKDERIYRNQKIDELWDKEQGNKLYSINGEIYEGTILEHILIQHLTAFYDVGEHNYIRLRAGDRMDIVDSAKERGESVACACLYGGTFARFADLIGSFSQKTGKRAISIAKELLSLLEDDIEIYNDKEKKREILRQYCEESKHTISGEKEEIDIEFLISSLSHKSEWIKEHVQKMEWIKNHEGYSWLNGYYDNHGKPIEGDSENGVRMILTSQVFAIMSGMVTVSQVKELGKAVDHYLLNPELGGYHLNTDFKEEKSESGRLHEYAYGTKENGSVFPYMSMLYANALYQYGLAKEGYKVIQTLYHHCMKMNTSKIYPGIPEYIDKNGKGIHPYSANAANLAVFTIVTEMFGIKPVLGDLVLTPKLTKEQFNENGKAEIKFIFAGKRLHVEYENKKKREAGEYQVVQMSLDGSFYPMTGGKAIIVRKNLELLSQEETHLIQIVLE